MILDDVISAVDAQTAQHIVRHCFRSDLMAGRTVIIASHAVEALALLAHRAVFLQDGRAVWQGSGNDLLECQYMAHLRADGASGAVGDVQDAQAAHVASDLLGKPYSLDRFEVNLEVHKTPRQLIVDENRGIGQTNFRLWTDLAKRNGGVLFWVTSLMFLVVASVLPVVRGKILE